LGISETLSTDHNWFILPGAINDRARIPADVPGEPTTPQSVNATELVPA
jgi:hypothetical protein